MSSTTSEEETEELVAYLSDDTEEEEEEMEEEEVEEPEHRSPRIHSDEEEDEGDELHIAARAGIRLLEENMHFREEVFRLNEQLMHLADEKTATERTLAERATKVEVLSSHVREAILENQSILSELSHTKEQLRSAQQEIATLQQRSPRRRPHQRLSPRRSAALSRSLVFADEADSLDRQEHSAASSGEVVASSAIASPTATGGDEPPSSILTLKPGDAFDRRTSFGELPPSPRRRPSLSRLREIEEKYEEEHQRCTTLKLELGFAQRRVSELKPLQSQLEEEFHKREAARTRMDELEKLLQQVQAERAEEQELIQSLRQTVHAYEQLNDPRQRGSSMDYDCRLGRSLQDGGGGSSLTAMTIERADDKTSSPSHQHNQQFARLDRAAEMIDGRFNLREENERLLQQLTAVTERVLTLTHTVIQSEEQSSGRGRRSSLTKERYLGQQVSVLQTLLRRFRLEWQHADDARVCLEDEKAELLKQLDRQRTKIQRTRSASVTSSRRASVESPNLPEEPVERPRKSVRDPVEDQEEEEEEGDDDDGDAAHERRLWERTNAICKALLRSSSPSTSKEDEAENELLCFALLRRLVDSWTTDKPKRMQLHDWLVNAIRHTGARKPLYLHELSSEIALGFQTLMVPMLQDKFDVQVHVEKRLRNVIVTDLRLHVLATSSDKPATAIPSSSAPRVQRLYHSLLSAIDGENGGAHGGDEYQEWLGNYSARRASRGYLAK